MLMIGRLHVLVFIFGAVLPGILAFSAEEQAGPDVELADDDGSGLKEVRVWINELADPDPTTRESARDALTRSGESCWPELCRVYHGTDDYEIRLTIRRIAEDGYLYEHLYRFHGFLGIQPQGVSTHGYSYPELHEVAGVSSIKVGRVVPGTAAERAGLKEKDLIYAVDQQVFDQSPSETHAGFMELLGGTIPGTKMTFSVMRIEAREGLTRQGVVMEPRFFDVEIALGFRNGTQFQQSQANLFLAYEKTRGDFSAFWTEEFESGRLCAESQKSGD
jgi:hypothetical protein